MKRTPNPVLQVFSYVFLGASTIFFWYSGIKDFLVHRAIATRGLQTTGTVTGHWAGGQGGRSPHDIYYTYTVSDVPLRGIATVSADVYDHTHDGDRLTVTYLPEAPATTETSLAPYVYGGVAGLLMGTLAFGITIFAATSQLRRRTQGNYLAG